jgi:hypothetical protein
VNGVLWLAFDIETCVLYPATTYRSRFENFGNNVNWSPADTLSLRLVLGTLLTPCVKMSSSKKRHLGCNGKKGIKISMKFKSATGWLGSSVGRAED